MDSVQALIQNSEQNSPSNQSRSPMDKNSISAHTPSNQSQDDLFRKHAEFGIFPIMERMTTNSNEFRRWFMYYLDQLLGIQCERILNRLRKTDDPKDSIYDVDTVNGSFIWKNELRIHWARSRIERRRLLREQIKPLINPFDHPKKKKSKVVKTEDAFDMNETPKIYEDAVLNSNDESEEDEEEEEEEDDDDDGGWFGAEGIVDLSDHEVDDESEEIE